MNARSVYVQKLCSWTVMITALWAVGCSRQKTGQMSGQGPGSRISSPVMLKVTLVPQKLTFWCWAASGQMIMAYLGVQVDQCDQANKELGRTYCCPMDERCDKGGWPQFEKYSFAPPMKTCRQAISWEAMKQELDNRRPVAFSWLYGDASDDMWTAASDPMCVKGGDGHMMVAIGYDERNGKQTIFYNDPDQQGVQQVQYNDFAHSSSLHHHWNDFYMLRKVGVSQ